MSRVRIMTIFFLVSVFCFGSFLTGGDFASASEADKIDYVVISEIQISGDGVNDEFIELYNPTDSEINLENWDLKRKTKNGNENNILNNIEGAIPSNGYFLIIPRANCGEDKNEDCYERNTEADDEYTTNSFLAENNTVLLYDDGGNLVDKIGWGEAGDFENEAAENNPEANQSLERKMAGGKIQDTDNNKNDFKIQDSPNPQNSIIIETENSDNTGGGNQGGQGLGEEDGSSSNENDDGGEPTPSPPQEGNSGEDNFDIIITELVLNPEDDDRENEFIEIYNQGDAEVNIGGWMMEDKLGGRITQFIFLENTILSSKEYRVFYRPETKITLNNSGDGVILKNSDGKIIDETDESGAALEDWSWSRNEDGEWEWSLTPTAGEENKIEIGNPESSGSETGKEPPLIPPCQGGEKEENFDYSDEIVISEIFPNPEGRDNQNGNYEWIELYNFSDQKINLRGWQIDDIIDGGSGAYFIEGDLEISARSYLTLDYSRTKIVLNNNGDEVNLLDPDGKIISKVVYEKGGEEGWSYARSEKELSSGYPELSSFSDSFMWSDLPTPGKENIFKEEPPLAPPSQGGEKEELSSQGGEEEIREEYSENNPQEISITEAKKLARYSWVKIKGTVSAPTGVFGEKTIYLSGSGIQVYSHQEDLPDLRAGDVVELTGRVSEIGGEKRILLSRADDLKIVGYQEEPEPMIILTGETAEPIEGYLVTVEGKVTETSGNVFYLDDGSGEVKIYIKPSTGIKKPSIKKGDWMVITGQVSRTSAGYRILPRFQDDIRLGRVSGISASLTEAGNSLFLVILILIGVMVLGDWGRIKLNRITNHES